VLEQSKITFALVGRPFFRLKDKFGDEVDHHYEECNRHASVSPSSLGSCILE
jgi:hypothetical protein